MTYDPTWSITWADRGVIGKASDEGLKGRIGRTSQECTRIIRCLWSDRFHVASWLRGGNDPVFGYVPPQKLPVEYQTGLTAANVNLYVDDVDYEMQVGANDLGQLTGYLQNHASDGTQIIGAKYALLAVHYRTLDWLAEQQLGTLSLDFATQWVSTPDPAKSRSTYAYNTATGTPVNEPIDSPVTVLEFSIGRYHLQNIPVSTIAAATASPANSVTLSSSLFPQLPSGMGTPGTVIFTGCHDDRLIDSFGGVNFNMQFKLKFRSIPWDQGINPTNGKWEQLVNIATGDPIILRSDLNALMTGTT